MTRTELHALVLRWMTFWQGANLDGFASIHSPDFVDHAASGRAPTREGFRDGVMALYASFPEFDARIEDVVIDEVSAKAVVRWSAEARHQGTFLGVAPTGRTLRFHGVEVLHCHDGLITDRWGEWDGESLLDQLRS